VNQYPSDSVEPGYQRSPDHKSNTLKKLTRRRQVVSGGDFDYTQFLSPEARQSYIEHKEAKRG